MADNKDIKELALEMLDKYASGGAAPGERESQFLRQMAEKYGTTEHLATLMTDEEKKQFMQELMMNRG